MRHHLAVLCSWPAAPSSLSVQLACSICSGSFCASCATDRRWLFFLGRSVQLTCGDCSVSFCAADLWRLFCVVLCSWPVATVLCRSVQLTCGDCSVSFCAANSCSGSLQKPSWSWTRRQLSCYGRLSSWQSSRSPLKRPGARRTNSASRSRRKAVSTEYSDKRNILTRAQWGSGESHILLGGGISAPVISKTTGPISIIHTPFDSPVRELSKHGVKVDLEIIDDVTGEAKFGHGIRRG